MGYKVLSKEDLNGLKELVGKQSKSSKKSLIQRFNTLKNAALASRDNLTFPLLEQESEHSIMEMWKNVRIQMVYGLYNKILVYHDVRFPGIDIPDGYHETDILQQKLMIAIRRIRKRVGNQKYMFRIENTGSGNFGNYETEIIPVSEFDKPTEYIIVHRYYNYSNNIYIVYIAYVNLLNNIICPMNNTSFYIGDHQKCNVFIHQDTFEILLGEFKDVHLKQILNGILYDIDNFDKSLFSFPKYSKEELKTVFSICPEMKHMVNSINIEKNAIVKDDELTDDDIKNLVQTAVDNDNIRPDANRTNWPIIKFTDKEWKSVFKYIDKEYRQKNKDYSIFDKLKDPKYGFDYRMPVNDKEICISYTIHDHDIIFILNEVLNDHVSAFMQFIVKNTEGKGFIPFTITSLMFVNPDLMKSKDMNFFEESFLINNPSDEVMDKVYAQFIAMMVTMTDRPERNKVISCQQSKPVPGNKHTVSTNPATGQTTYITRRILAPASAAKDYVVKMTRDHKNRDAIYTIEEWDRREHLRHLKNGKVIFIRASHCVRKAGEVQPADEIHLKL